MPGAHHDADGAWLGRAAAVLAVAGETAMLALAIAGLAGPPVLVAAHVALSLLLVAIAALAHRRGPVDPAFLLLVVATALMGPFGALGAAAGALLRRRFSLQAIPFEQWYALLVPTLETSPTRLLYERLVVRRGEPASRSTVASFQDIMALGTVQQKQIVLTAIADEFRPDFAPALARALNDMEPAVRVQAATVSARIEHKFLERSLLLEERRLQDPTSPETALALARHHDEWAATGLLDAARARNERLQALENYERLDALRPGEPETSDAIGRLLLQLDLPERALPGLEAGAARQDAPPLVLALHLDCLYRLRRIAHLRRTARAYWPSIAESALPDDMREAARLWAGAAPAHAPHGAVR